MRAFPITFCRSPTLQAGSVGVPAEAFEQLMVTEYAPGAGIGWPPRPAIV